MGHLLAALRSRPGPAIIDDGGSCTWADLHDRVDALVAHFAREGLAPGSSVLVMSPNRREVAEVHVACLEGGWTCVPVNWHFDADDVARVMVDMAAAALVVSPVLLGLVMAALDRLPDPHPTTLLVLDGEQGGDGWPDGFREYEQALESVNTSGVEARGPGDIVFSTSGTTGRSRGVRYLADPVADAAAGIDDPSSAVVRYLRPALAAAAIPAEGRTLLCGPHYHWAQWTFGVLPLLGGSTLVMQSRFVPANVLASIDQQFITNLLLVPTQFVRLLRLDAQVRASFDGSALERVVHGAAPCAPDVKRSMIDWWGPVFTEYYGATEGGVITLTATDEWLERPDSVGRPIPSKQVTVVADDGRVAEPGTDGVVHVRSVDGLMIEYVGAPAATAATRALPGHVTFGDMARLDHDGYLYLSDRRSDMIVTGGVNVASAAIEAVLMQHPSVADAAVFGIPDATSGQVVRAAVQLAGGVVDPADEAAVSAVSDELREFCCDRLPAHQCPAVVEIRDRLPRTASGKLVKRRLRAPYWEPHIGPVRR
jgi:long-chain acyl-CoA synthetase